MHNDSLDRHNIRVFLAAASVGKAGLQRCKLRLGVEKTTMIRIYMSINSMAGSPNLTKG
jgi:hypothetical protein